MGGLSTAFDHQNADRSLETKRWQHEGIIDRTQKRLDPAPEAMRMRRQTVEHPFETIKAWSNAPPDPRAETGPYRNEPHVFADNPTRIISILGVHPLLEAITA